MANLSRLDDGWGSQQRVQRNALVAKDEPQFIHRCAAPTACAVGLEQAEQSRAHSMPTANPQVATIHHVNCGAIDGQVRSVSHWSRAYKKYSTKRATCVLALSAASRLPKYASRRPESLTASPFSTKSRLSTYLPQCAKLRAVLCCATQCHACLLPALSSDYHRTLTAAAAAPGAQRTALREARTARQAARRMTLARLHRTCRGRLDRSICTCAAGAHRIRAAAQSH